MYPLSPLAPLPAHIYERQVENIKESHQSFKDLASYETLHLPHPWYDADHCLLPDDDS